MPESIIDVTPIRVGLPEPEFVENPTTRCPVCLLLDTSGSMSGRPITELSEGIRILEATLKEDNTARYSVEISVVTFNSSVNVIQDFITVNEFKSPTNLVADGSTSMGAAINKGIDLITERKQIYRANGIPYHRPWVFLITDGAPTDSWERAAQRVQQAENERQLLFFAIGVEGADMNTLRQIAPNLRPPMMLRGMNFQGLFQWLSNSLAQVAHSNLGDRLALPPVNPWAYID